MLNKGITLGLFPGISIYLIAGLWCLYFIYNFLQIRAGKMRELSERVGAFLILVGGAGNIVSRIFYGGVVDNFNFFGLMNNNIWDYFIGGGVIMMIYHEFSKQRANPSK